MIEYILILALAALLWYSTQAVQKEERLSLDSTVTRTALFEFLKSPVNLERIHPRIQKVTEVETVGNDTMRFQIEESVGFGLVNIKVPIVLVAFSDVSHFTSHIQIEANSSMASVTVTMAIRDYDTKVATEKVADKDQVPLVTVDVSVRVKAWRLITYLTSSLVADAWYRTIQNTSELLIGKSSSQGHENSS